MAERIAVDLEVNDKTADGIRSAISNADHLRISFEQAGDSMDLDGPFMNKDNEGNEFIKLVRKWDEFVKNWDIEMWVS